MKRYILSLLSLVVLAACSSYDESFEMPTDNNNIAEKYFVYANIDNTSNTRVDITSSTNADGKPIIKVNWEESGEQFLVYQDYELSQSSNATAYQFSQVSGNQFTGDIPVNGKGYSAFYNCSLSLGQSGPHTHKMNYDMSEQNGTGDKVLMMGESKEGTGVIDFDHLGFILKPTFKYKNAGMDDWGVLNSSITKIEMGGDLQYVDDEDSKKQITVTPTSALNDIYIFLPKLSLYPYATQTNAEKKVQYKAGDTFTFKVTTEDGEYTGSLTLPAEPTLEAGKFYTATIKLTNTRSYLPSCSTFRSKLVNAIKNHGNTINYIMFKAKSNNTSGTEITGITGSPAYIEIDGSTLKIHSEAERFVFPSNCSEMFYYITDSGTNIFNTVKQLDLTNCDTSGVEKMKKMFAYCTNLYAFSYTEELFDTSNVTDMSEMFSNFGINAEIKGFGLTLNFNTSKVTNMTSMFEGCAVGNLDISSFDMSKVTSVTDMFNWATWIKTLKLGNFSVPAGCDLTNMFYGIGLSTTETKIYVSSQDVINRLKGSEYNIGITIGNNNVVNPNVPNYPNDTTRIKFILP